ncbi:MAG TPA: condensation domain-containing protein, partial [Symbiobacteriaceae bacterium]|nr:condensation domain-containing protein [Symbiobacteriaceae bacterium]
MSSHSDGGDKRAMLARLLAQKAVEATKPQPAAPAQERLWFMEQLAPGTAVYNIPGGLWLTGPVDVAVLERSVAEVMKRHAALRTTFVEGEAGLPAQLVGQPQPFALPVTDLTHLPLEEARAEAMRLAEAEGRRPFDLSAGPLARFALCKVAADLYLFHFALHHIISDLWSIGVILRELEVLYGAFAAGQPSPLSPLTRSYLAYAAEQRDQAVGAGAEAQLAYWKQKLGGRLPVLQLPTDRSRPGVQTYQGALAMVDVEPELKHAVDALARREGATRFMVMLAAFKALLYRYTRQTDLIVGTPVANRNRAEDEALVGLFANTLALRTELAGDLPFAELIARVRETCLGAYANQEMDFAKLMEVLQPERALGASPLFQVMFNLANAASAEMDLPGIHVAWAEVHSATAKYDLTVSLSEDDSVKDGLVMRLEYDTALFDAATMHRMGQHYKQLLAGAAANPQTPLDELPLMPAEELAVLAGWNRTEADYPRKATLHGLVEAQAAATPDWPAVLFDGRTLTYGELNRQANQVARHLRALGVGPDVLVGLSMERSEAMLVGLLGILKAGGAYVPLDPTYPADRLAYMLEDSEAKVLVTCGGAPVAFAGAVVDLERDRAAIAAHEDTNLAALTSPDNAAYVIYTSGSTGRPKGVVVEHRGVVNFLTSMRQRPGLTMGDALLAVTSISFDIHVLELYLPLTTGAQLVLASRADALDGHRLAGLMQQHGVTVMQATPATWRLLLESGWQAPPGLKLLTGGEALSRELASRLLAGGAELWNMYGPTETTVWSTVWRVVGGPILIGRPIANTQVHVLDSKLRPVPVG